MLIHRVKNARGDWVLDLGICVLPWSRAARIGKSLFFDKQSEWQATP